ncbi:MAG: hypothetical protein SPL30_10205 [Succinivibrio sp.]|nr:hypothetical protein [Succinivibrio sp.]
MFTYRIGWPLWKLIYRLTRCRLSYRFDVFKTEVGDYSAFSPDLKGLCAECPTIEEVCKVVADEARQIVEFELYGVNDGGNKMTNTVPDLIPTGILGFA